LTIVIFTKALALFAGPEPDAASRLLGHSGGADARPAAQRYERAASLRRRAEHLERVLARLDGVLRAVHAAPQLVLVRHPHKGALRRLLARRPGGRLGPLPGQTELAERGG